MLVISLKGTQIEPNEQHILVHQQIGGLILFARNFKNKQQLQTLTTQIKTINPNLVIMVDHEGGRIWRFKNHEFSKPAPMQELGVLYDHDPQAALAQAYQCGYKIATDLLACGIDLNLAPVVDLNHNNISSVIGDRAFHSQPNIVATLAAKFISGQQAAGMQAVGKHFPGHGAIKADTHLTNGVDNRTKEEIFNQDLKAFKLLIDGEPSLNIPSKSLPAVMPAHIVYPAIDDKPAGCSKIWLQDILRKSMKFDGVIISDCLSMNAAQEFIKKNTSESKISSLIKKLHLTKQQALNFLLTKESLEAGCDLIIFNSIHDQDLISLLTCLDKIDLDISSINQQNSHQKIKNLLAKMLIKIN